MYGDFFLEILGSLLFTVVLVLHDKLQHPRESIGNQRENLKFQENHRIFFYYIIQHPKYQLSKKFTLGCVQRFSSPQLNRFEGF